MGESDIGYNRLSKTVSHALRHAPWLYELELDNEGWVPVSQLLQALRSDGEGWKSLAAADLEEMIRTSSKRRHEIRDGRIRAIYGHSLPVQLKRKPSAPPEILYHGTSPASVPRIRARGLRPMNRQNVHLSTEESTAIEVGRRKARNPVLLRVRSLEAFDNGVPFYKGNENVWLADAIPSQFIDF